MTTDVFGTDTPTVQRDRWGRPLITPPGGGKPTAFTRVTKFVSALEDTFALGRWQQRQLAVGLSGRPDLILAAAAHRDDKAKLDELVDQAHEAAGTAAAATTGTALHRLAEQLDRGELTDLDRVPEQFRPDLEAYRRATAGFRYECIEQLMVSDEWRCAGTPDRLGFLPGDPLMKVLDIKTGSVEYGMSKIAMQLAVYANSLLYNVETGERTRLDIDLNRAIVVHLPAGQGVCELHEVDIATALDGVQLAYQVRAWRSVRRLARPLQSGRTRAAPPEAIRTPVTRTLLDQIDDATSVDELTAIWSTNRSTWTTEATAAAVRRKQQLSIGGHK